MATLMLSWGERTFMKRALGKMIVGNLLTNAAERYPDAPAFYCAGTRRRFTFRETDERTNRLAQAMLGLGLKKGDVVALILSNRVEMVEVFFALARTGIIGLPLNYRLATSEMVELTRSMRATALVYEGRFASEAEAVHQQLPGIGRIISIDSPQTDFGHDYEELLRGIPAPARDRDRRGRPLLLQPHIGNDRRPQGLHAHALQ